MFSLASLRAAKDSAAVSAPALLPRRLISVSRRRIWSCRSAIVCASCFPGHRHIWAEQSGDLPLYSWVRVMLGPCCAECSPLPTHLGLRNTLLQQLQLCRLVGQLPLQGHDPDRRGQAGVG